LSLGHEQRHRRWLKRQRVPIGLSLTAHCSHLPIRGRVTVSERIRVQVRVRVKGGSVLSRCLAHEVYRHGVEVRGFFK